MKSLTIIDERGTFTIGTSATLTEIATRVGSMDKALAAMSILCQMSHNCDSCNGTQDVEYQWETKEHKCSECLVDWE